MRQNEELKNETLENELMLNILNELYLFCLCNPNREGLYLLIVIRILPLDIWKLVDRNQTDWFFELLLLTFDDHY